MALKKPTTKATANSYNWYSRRAGAEAGSGKNSTPKMVDEYGNTIVDEDGNPILAGTPPGELPTSTVIYSQTFQELRPVEPEAGVTYDANGLSYNAGSSPVGRISFDSIAGGTAVPKVIFATPGIIISADQIPTLKAQVSYSVREGGVRLTSAEILADNPGAIAVRGDNRWNHGAASAVEVGSDPNWESDVTFRPIQGSPDSVLGRVDSLEVIFSDTITTIKSAYTLYITSITVTAGY